MKKLVSILLTFALLLSVSVTAFAEEATPTNQKDAKYSISVGDSDIELAKGETVEIPLTLIPKEGTVHPNVDFPGTGGILSLTAGANYVFYRITPSVPIDNFTGIMSITDLTSGLSNGNAVVSGLAGQVAYSGYKNHMYRASLDGTGTLLGIPYIRTNPNGITWTHNW
ncbi:hypothetical protein [Paenibacillus sp. BJ-4]|uniref:hypothetical protein n=1 Tax=Paenibacillus sp. BJ-4 TaxID=2878097 RepID=UPI001CEFCE0A|nr:hypothetical protein [Paenibacillus sp. BJ-4]